MAEAYGKLPTQVLYAEGADMSDMALFRVNQNIHTATSKFKEAMQGQGSGNGPANSQQQNQLIQKNQDRANKRQRLQDSGKSTPNVSTQTSALAEAREKRGIS